MTRHSSQGNSCFEWKICSSFFPNVIPGWSVQLLRGLFIFRITGICFLFLWSLLGSFIYWSGIHGFFFVRFLVLPMWLWFFIFFGKVWVWQINCPHIIVSDKTLHGWNFFKSELCQTSAGLLYLFYAGRERANSATYKSPKKSYLKIYLWLNGNPGVSTEVGGWGIKKTWYDSWNNLTNVRVYASTQHWIHSILLKNTNVSICPRINFNIWMIFTVYTLVDKLTFGNLSAKNNQEIHPLK